MGVAVVCCLLFVVPESSPLQRVQVPGSKYLIRVAIIRLSMGPGRPSSLQGSHHQVVHGSRVAIISSEVVHGVVVCLASLARVQTYGVLSARVALQRRL